MFSTCHLCWFQTGRINESDYCIQCYLKLSQIRGCFRLRNVGSDRFLFSEQAEAKWRSVCMVKLLLSWNVSLAVNGGFMWWLQDFCGNRNLSPQTLYPPCSILEDPTHSRVADLLPMSYTTSGTCTSWRKYTPSFDVTRVEKQHRRLQTCA